MSAPEPERRNGPIPAPTTATPAGETSAERRAFERRLHRFGLGAEQHTLLTPEAGDGGDEMLA